VIPVEPVPAEATAPTAPVRQRRGCLFTGTIAVLVVVVGAAAIAAIIRASLPHLTETDVEQVVLTTLAQETEASFLVTGTLAFGTTVEQRRTTTFLPGIVDLPVGSEMVTVRVPSRVAYGFDLSDLDANDIRFAEDGTVEVDLPPLRVFSVEPELEDAQIRTEAGGWMRFAPTTDGAEQTRQALAAVRPAARTQAERHLARADQPRTNAARAVVRMLTPPLRAAGLEAPRYRIRLGSGATLTLDGDAVPAAPGPG